MRKPKADDKSRAKKLDAVARRFEAFRPAVEVLKKVRAVPTRFVQFDHASRVGGLPIERYMLLHGPSNEGKTLFTLGLVDSFLARDHFVYFIDAERTTSQTWVGQLIGERLRHPRFYAMRPDSYEDTVARTREFLNAVTKSREEGEVPEDTSALVVVDSLKRLTPANLMKEVLKAEQDAKDISGGNDRVGQLKAKMNGAWAAELVPQLDYAQASAMMIAREMEDPDADAWARQHGFNYKIGGGKDIYFDSSMVIRTERESYVQHGEGKDRKVYGERHRVTIRKTKVGGKEDKVATCHFHSSNGTHTPFGFDRARDVLELAIRFGIVERAGSWYSHAEQRLGAGEHNAVKVLANDPEWLDAVETEVRAKFADVSPQEHDEETGEVTS